MNFSPDDVLSRLLSSPAECRTEQLQSLLRTAQQSPQVFSDCLKRTLNILQITLTDPLVEISLLSTNLISALLGAYREDLEPFMQEILGILATNLGDSQPVLRKASHSCLLTYIRATGNFEAVLRGFLDNGVDNPEWQVRQKCINSFQSLFLSEGRLLKWDSFALKKLVEALIDKLHDPNAAISKASEQALLSLQSSDNFRILLKTLPKPKHEAFLSFLEAHKAKLQAPTPKELPISALNTHNVSNLSTPVKEMPTISQNITPKSSNFISIASNLLDKPPETLPKSPHPREVSPKKIFGIFSKTLVDELLFGSDWQSRSSAIEQLERETREIELRSREFLPHFFDFLRLLLRLLQDNNFKICLTSLNLLSKLLVFEEMRGKSALELVLPRLLEKLGDSKIAIRQASARIIKETHALAPAFAGNFWFEALRQGLESTGQHVREETLGLLAFFLEKTNGIDEGFSESALAVALKFLWDSKSKVQNAAWEVLKAAEMRVRREKFEEIVEKNLEEPEIQQVLERFPGRKSANIGKSDVKIEKIEKSDEKIEKIEKINSKIEKTNSKFEKIEKTSEILEKTTSNFEKTANNISNFDRSATNFDRSSNEKPSSSTNNSNNIKKVAPIVANHEVSTSCSSRSFQETRPLIPNKKENVEEKRTFSAFSLKTSAVSEELEKINENRSDSSEKSPGNRGKSAISKPTRGKSSKKLPSFSLKDRESEETVSENSEKPLKPEKFTRNEKYDGTLQVQSREYQRKSSETSEISKDFGNKSSNFDYKKACYIEKSDLQPLKQPDSALKLLVSDLKTDDWSRQFEALSTLRRIISFHSDLLVTNSNILHALTLDLLRLIESLRSSLSKNAMLATTELVEKLKKQLDSEADLLLSRLMRKGLDSNAFISEEVKRGLLTVATNCSETKVIPFLLTFSTTKAAQAKLNLILCYEALFKKWSSRVFLLKDYEKLLSSLAGFLFDSSNDVRNLAKTVFLSVFSETLDRSELDRALLRTLSPQMYAKVQTLLEKHAKKPQVSALTASSSLKKPVSSNLRFKKSTTPDNPRSFKEIGVEVNNFFAQSQFPEKSLGNCEKIEKIAANPKKPYKSSLDTELLSELLAQISASDWKIRLQIVEKLRSFGENHCQELNTHQSSASFLDGLVKLMLDANAKVSLAALQNFAELCEKLEKCVETSVVSVLTAVFQALGSFNAGIRAAAADLLEKVVEILKEKHALLQPLCNGAAFANGKARIAIIEKLTEIVEDVFYERPNLVNKHVGPLILRLFEENKPEIKQNLQKLARKLEEIMGEELWKTIPKTKHAAFAEFLRK